MRRYTERNPEIPMPARRPSIDPTRLRHAAAEAVGALKVLANEDRLLLLCQLSQGELCVGDLEAALDIRQPTLSQQLGVLRNEGVVDTRREGKRIFYRVADPHILQVLEALYRLYCPKD
jgi:ArsR family transcriptional regulator